MNLRILALQTALLACALLIGSCNQNDSNQALYDEVMAIHDEVMPKMNDLYKKKTSLSAQLSDSTMSSQRRDSIQSEIAQIDSASEGMMVWMRNFEPIADSVGEEKAREYLEAELVKVKKVRDDINQALQAN